jgi:hypothetical protein
LFFAAHRLVVVVTGVAAGPVSLMFDHQYVAEGVHLESSV